MRFLIIFILLPTIVCADQGVNIFCVNMKKLLDKEYKIHKFKFDVTTFQYFDEKKNIFVEVPNKNLIIKPNFFAARFSEYELGFQINSLKKLNEKVNFLLKNSKSKNKIPYKKTPKLIIPLKELILLTLLYVISVAINLI